jgi:hypothetical protein
MERPKTVPATARWCSNCNSWEQGKRRGEKVLR